MVEGELSTPRDIQAGVPQGTVLSSTLYINDTTQTPGVNLALFADDTCIYTTDREDGYVLRKLQRGLISMKSWRVERCKKCIACQERYFEKETVTATPLSSDSE
jgi:hypothetical protein